MEVTSACLNLKILHSRCKHSQKIKKKASFARVTELMVLFIYFVLIVCLTFTEPASPGPDSDTTMDTMEVDSSDMEMGRGLDDPEEPSTPDGMFSIDSPFSDREKDEDPIKTIR